MSHNEIIRNFFIYAAAINKIAGEDKENLLLQELSDDVQSSLLANPQYLSYTGPLFKNNVLFANKEGEILPTISRGWGTINPQPQVKVVNKMQPKPVEKMTNVEILTSFIESGFAICHRLPSDRLMQKKAREAYSEVADVLTCVTTSFNDTFAPQVETVVEEVAVVTKAKKAKKEVVGA